MPQQNMIFNQDNTLSSAHFDDIYFSNQDAIAEKQYVFIEANQLTQRFIHHNQGEFTIVETGFGTVLNFLIAWHCFLNFRQNHPNHQLNQLQFLSIEKFPLTQEEMQKAHSIMIGQSALKRLSTQLLSHWPSTNNHFDSAQLSILFDDVEHYPNFLTEQKCTIDCLFLDGFTPTKNPEMWSTSLFKVFHQLASPDITLSTYTASGMVRRNLIEAGFMINKHKGYAQKREMLIGYLAQGSKA